MSSFLLLAGGCGGGDTTTPDGGMAQPDGFAPVDDCPGIPITQDGTLDVDLKSIHVTGAVTLNGAALPNTATSRGSILFREKYTGTMASADLLSTGAGRFDVYLAPGEYDVLFAGRESLCANAMNLMPCSTGVLKKSLMLTASGVVDLDLQTATVQGKFSVNGAAVPAAYATSTFITFQTPDKELTSVSPTAASGYRIVLLKGSYAIGVAGQTGCDPVNPVPCVGGPVIPSMSFQSDGVVDLNVKTVKVTGKVTVNGQPIAAANRGLGYLRFRLASGAVAGTPDLGNYQLTLLAGTYDVLYSATGNDCTAGVPCIGGLINKAVSIQSDGVIDIDLPAITVQGTVLINGQAVVEGNEKGTVVFAGSENYTVATLSTGPRLLGSYKVVLLRGVYDLRYAWTATNCGGAAAKGPCMSGTLKPQVSLSSSGTVDIDIPSITVTGRVTVNGSAVPAASLMAGRIDFVLGVNQVSTTNDLGALSQRLLPGVYDIGYTHPSAVCPMTEGVPCTSGRVLTGRMLTSSGVVDVDLPMITVSGKVTMNGMPMPTISSTRGSLQFSSKTGGAVTANFGPSGAVTYRMPLLPGPYKLLHLTDFSMCAANTGAVPCVAQVLAGCM